MHSNLLWAITCSDVKLVVSKKDFGSVSPHFTGKVGEEGNLCPRRPPREYLGEYTRELHGDKSSSPSPTVPVVPFPIPTDLAPIPTPSPSPLFLSPFPSPSPCYKISLTQCTNHQIISQYFSLANVHLTVSCLFHNIKFNIKVPKEVHSLHCTVYNVHFQSSPWSKSKSVHEEQSIHWRSWQFWPTFFQCTTSQGERPLRWGTSGWHSQKPSGNTCHRK